MKAGQRGKGIGHLLVARFVEICAAARSSGIHVVTSASSRAVKFYEACDFTLVTPYAGLTPALPSSFGPSQRLQMGAYRPDYS